ncbi:SdrD B-like domain-containing protein, partial [Desulfobacterales bacterium HSG2]|nr:SdrD B-like domain-containing protein [Desulfobacterales bacterium HSG2]
MKGIVTKKLASGAAWALLVVFGFISVCLTPGVMAHNVDQRMAWMFFDQETIELIKANVDADREPVNAGDELGIIIKNLPQESGATTGVGGYVTYYIPAGVRVIDVGYVWPDGNGGYKKIPMKGQSIMSLGDGPAGGGSTIELQGLTLGPNAVGVTSPAVDPLGGSHLGTLAGVYGDTGIFFSSDPDTVWQSWANDSNGNYSIVNNRGELIFPNNKWDAEQLLAYGSSSPSKPIVDYSNGRGNAPWGLASGVAGPESGYAWQFDKEIWDANPTSAGMKDAANDIGPWNRIQYPGSMIGKDSPGSEDTTLGYAGVDASGMGVTVSAIPANTNAIRWSVGMLVASRPEYVYVKIKIMNEPPLDPFIDEAGCFQLHGDVFGGDAGGEQGGKDHLWRYYDPTHAFIDTCSAMWKDANLDAAPSGSEFTFTVAYWNTGRQDVTGIEIIDTLPNGLELVSAVPAPLTTDPLTWHVASLAKGEMWSAVLTVRATSSGAMISNTITATNDQGGYSESTDGVWLGAAPLLNMTKTVTPDSAAPGSNVQYSLIVQNDGSGPSGNPLTFTEYLPEGFTFVSIDKVTAGGATVTAAASADSTNPAQPVFEVNIALEAGKQMVLTFTAKIGDHVPSATYYNTFSLTHRDPAVGTVTAASGAEAPVTVGGAAIGGNVFHDWNNNGTKNQAADGTIIDEGIGPDIASIVLELDNGGCTTGVDCPTTTVDENGDYIFNGLIAGTYPVKILSGVPDAYTASTPETFTITLANDTQKSLENNVGYLPGGNGSIGNLFFEDKSNDGTFDIALGDTGIPNITLNLYEDSNGNGEIDAEDALITSTISNANGVYGFTNLPEGLNYIVDADQNDPDLAAHFAPYTSLNSTPDPQPVPNLTGANDDADFGFFAVVPGSIGDQLFLDENANGVYDEGDAPLAFVTVNLYQDINGDGEIDAGDRLFKTTISDVSGGYLLDEIGPGNYIVDVDNADTEIPGGYVAGNDPTVVTLAIAENRTDVDFPFVQLISKSVDKESASPGDTLTYTIIPTYPGGDVLSNVVVTDAVPAGTTFVSAVPAQTSGPDPLTWNLGSSAAGIPGGTEGAYACASEVVNLAAVQDTFIDESNVAADNSTTGDLMTRPQSLKQKRIFIKFDTAGIPAGATVASAELHVTSAGSRNNHNVGVHQVTSDWTDTANWNSPWISAGGDFDATALGSLIPDGNVQQLDITTLLQDWLSGDQPNHGIALVATGTDTGDAKWRSLEKGEPDAPHIKVYYTYASPGGCVANENFPATQDTFVQEDNPTKDYSTQKPLMTRPDAGNRKTAFIKF